MKRQKLSKSERAIEDALLRGEFKPVSAAEYQAMLHAIIRKRKDAVLNIRINSGDLESLRQKAKRLGVPYQTFISELLHRFAA